MSKRPNDHMQTFFESIDVNPDMVYADGIDKSGYWSMIREGSSEALMCDDFTKPRYFHEWPDSMCWDRFLTAEAEDYKASRRVLH